MFIVSFTLFPTVGAVPFEHLLEAGILWPEEAVDIKKAKACYNLQRKEVLTYANTF